MARFSDLARAAYCPRQLYYARRRDDRELPKRARERIRLAFRYPELRVADDATLRSLPLDASPTAYRAALDALAERDVWPGLVDPDERRVRLAGKDARGVVHKIVERGDDDPPTPVLVSPGRPPEEGVWEPQSVRAVAAAKALAWERERPVPDAVVEYPGTPAVRRVRVTTRKKAAYRRALRVAESLDGPPPRLRGSEKCDACDYRENCGVRTRSLRSRLLGR